MNENIKIEHMGDYVHARQYGPDSYDASLELWQHIVVACEEHNCFNILGESFTTKALTTLEAFDHIKIFKLAGITLKHRIAWVNHSKETVDSSRFAETALRNRGLINGHLFPTLAEAKHWLLGDSMDNKADAEDGT